MPHQSKANKCHGVYVTKNQSANIILSNVFIEIVIVAVIIGVITNAISVCYGW